MITQELLKEFLKYNQDTGDFTWLKKPCKSVMVGDTAGSIGERGIRNIGFNHKEYKAHRLAWLYVHGYMPKIIDHINLNPSDNSIANLRECTVRENSLNVGIKKMSSSGVKNVMWKKDRSKWAVKLRVNGIYKHFGYFDDLELAGLVAVEAREKHHGQFARHT